MSGPRWVGPIGFGSPVGFNELDQSDQPSQRVMAGWRSYVDPHG